MNNDEYISGIEKLGVKCVTNTDYRDVVWRRFGTGPDLILIHGGHGSWLHWIRNIKNLSTSRTLLIPDLPGFGDSSDLGSDESDPILFNRLIEILQTSMLKIRGNSEPVDVIAFSFGALIAAKFASLGLVSNLALIGPAGHGGNQVSRERLISGWKKKDQQDRIAALRHNLQTLMMAPQNIDNLALHIYEAQCNASRFNVRSLVQSNDLFDKLNGYKKNLLFIWGALDVTAVPHEMEFLIKKNIKNTVDVKIISEAGHWVQYERPVEVSDCLSEWLSSKI